MFLKHYTWKIYHYKLDKNLYYYSIKRYNSKVNAIIYGNLMLKSIIHPISQMDIEDIKGSPEYVK